MIQERISGDHYLALKSKSEGLYKDRGSKFIAIALPLEGESQLNELLDEVKKQYYDARHWCYAYRCQPKEPQVRFNDDGEPAHSAGTPIFNAIQSSELWNVLVVVVRYFGGTKLGVPGLIKAYRGAAEAALSGAKHKDVYLYRYFEMRFPYEAMDAVMRVLPHSHFEIFEEAMAADAGYKLRVRLNNYNEALQQITDLYQIKLKEINEWNCLFPPSS